MIRRRKEKKRRRKEEVERLIESGRSRIEVVKGVGRGAGG